MAIKKLEDFNFILKTAKKNWRTFLQQKYRNELAWDLKDERKLKHWNNIAKAHLEKEKISIEYVNSLWKWRKVWKGYVEELIKAWYWEEVIKKKNIVEWLNDVKLSHMLIEAWYLKDLAYNLNKFELLDLRTAKKLIDARYFEKFAININRFRWLDFEIAKELIRSRKYWIYVVFNIDKFEWSYHKEIAEMLIWRWFWNEVLNKIDEFEKSCHKQVIEYLIKRWYWEKILKKIDNFERSYHKEILKMLVRAWYWKKVVKKIDNSEYFDEGFAKELIDEWYRDIVTICPEKFWLKKEK